ncbi:MAG: 2-C-methyl-D-erythritol 4-phosphate cytidylyltransferase [Lachnospiraceae bacterium]|nr:2-C-methyl-D-erythritol 4-phosphate cytidylyltransferase [Lachnospiraceae bacterium]
MNYGLILAGGVGQRMRRTGMPKQFLEVFGKPIIIYTLQKFEYCETIDTVVVACHSSWKDYLESMISRYGIKKVKAVISGGKDRQDSVLNGLKYIKSNGASDDDVVVIHDGVRPLIQENILSENVRVAQKYGNAMTVRPVIESVIITDREEAGFEDFKKRDNTFSLTAPQSFRLGVLMQAYKDVEGKETPMPLLDSALVFTYLGNKIHIIKENNNNIKVTTPEDYYILKAMLELEENRYVFGIN